MIRRANDADAVPLSALKRATFRETFVEGFGIPYPPADLAAFEASSYAVDAVARSLRDPGVATWVIEEGKQLLAYAETGSCKLPHPDASARDGELRQLYVARIAQGRGFGGLLLKVALAHLEATFAGPIWLGVWSGNVRAQAIYRAHAFNEAGSYRFAVGSWLDDELIFRRDPPS